MQFTACSISPIRPTLTITSSRRGWRWISGGKGIEASEENAKPSVHRWTVGLVVMVVGGEMGEGGGSPRLLLASSFRKKGHDEQNVSNRDKRVLQRCAPWDKLIQGYHVPLPFRSLRECQLFIRAWMINGQPVYASPPCSSCLHIPLYAMGTIGNETDGSAGILPKYRLSLEASRPCQSSLSPPAQS